MIWIRNFFTIYVVLLMLAIGIYIVFIQSPNLLQEKMIKEGQVLRVIGYVYFVIGIIGLFICMRQ